MTARSSAPPRGPERPEPDLVADRYELTRLLGRGGMAEVHEASDLGSGERVALKRIHFDRARHRAAARLRFRREFHTLARLRHPRIVRTLDYGIDEGRDFYTMELLDGHDLAEAAKDGALDVVEVCRILRDVASALAYLHSRRLIHRDLSPRNVRLTADGTAKLIDFGVIATPGVAREVAGTPMLVAPEGPRGQPLDERTDVFGLGALAYWMLVGRHAYPARRLDDLEDAWRVAPTPLVTLRDDIPPALRELVSSMIHVDPDGRPRSMAEVWDRLSGIAGLPPVPEVEAARDFVLTPRLVGRRRELSVLRACAREAVRDGRGAALVVEAKSGGGKSRLLHEAGVEAQLAGATVARVQADAADATPYAVASNLVEEVIRACPKDALEVAAPRAATLGRVLAPIRARFSETPLSAPLSDPAEDRLRVQAEVTAFFLDLAARRPLALLVDDVQRADESSAAVLATLGRGAAETGLYLVAALRSDERSRARAAIDALASAGLHVRLESLDEADVRELVVGTFGDVENARALAELLHQKAGGSPMRCMELLRYLVDEGEIRYAEGSWLIPPRLDHVALPADLAAAMDHRVRLLPPPARDLGEALAVQGGELSLDRVRRLADPDADDDAVFDALDALVFHEILGGSGTSWRFRHDGLREALLRGIGDERRVVLHRRAAHALAPDGVVPPDREAEVGWHLVRGGDEAAGAELLERAGRRLYEARSFRDAIGPLETALRSLEARGGSEARRLELRKMLMRGGVLCDRRVLLEYADGTLAALGKYAGMTTTGRLRPWLGRAIALAMGQLLAWIAWALSRPSRRGPAPHRALADFVLLTNYTASAHSLSFDTDAMEELIVQMEPLSILRHRVPGAAAVFTRNFLRMSVGHFGATRRAIPAVVEVLRNDRLTPMPEIDRRLGIGGALYMLASAEVLQTDPRFERNLETLASLELRFFDASIQMARLFFHRLRGEEERAQAAQAEGEMHAVQLGSAWIFGAQLGWISALAYGLTGDLLGLKRSAVTLERMTEEGYRFGPLAAIARADYARARGDAATARAALATVLDQLPPRVVFLRQWCLAVAADAALESGDPVEAAALARASLSVAEDPEDLLVVLVGRASRTLGLALAETGALDEARAALGDAGRRLEAFDNPVVVGLLEEALARVADRADDPAAAAQHRLAAEARFRSTDNPVLLARAERLGSVGAAHRPSLEPSPADDAATVVQGTVRRSRVAAVLSGVAARERPARILALCVEQSGAVRGWLFRVRGLRLERIAGDDDAVAPAMLEPLRELMRRGDWTTTSTNELSLEAPGADGRRWVAVPLDVAHPRRREMVAAAVLEVEGEPRPVPAGFRAVAARALLELDSEVSDSLLKRMDAPSDLGDETEAED